MKKKLQVFLSSTYKDLIEERQAAVEAVLSQGHIPAGMQLFKSGDESQLETIKRWIDESDIYVLILGGRYGSIEPESKLSYTQLEYEYAVKKGMHFFSIVITENALDQKVKYFGRDVIETDNCEKYKSFKKTVLSKISTFYNDNKDIKIAIGNSIADFEKRFQFKGWISGDILEDYEDIKLENKRLVEQIQKESLSQSNTINTGKILDETASNDENELTAFYAEPASFFWERVAGAFPGIRGVKWFYNPKEIVERLQLLFKEPIKFKSGGNPIWFFHGSSGLNIEKFEVLSDTKVLMGCDEIEIEKIAVHHSSVYYKDFIYVEAKAEAPIGIYNTTQENIERQIKDLDYASEHYGLLGTTPISSAEYDDGSAVINGKVVDAKDAESRVRYLSRYNFIIVAKTSPYNSNKCFSITKVYLKGILNGTHDFDGFVSSLMKLPKYPRD